MILVALAFLVWFAAAMVVLFLSERATVRDARDFQRTARHAARAPLPSPSPYELTPDEQWRAEMADLEALWRAPSAKREARP